MEEKSLRETAHEIKALINQGRAGEAIGMAQSLLRRVPRYLLGYRLLAEAALEQGYSHDALEVFRRVLSADPESFVAHAGMAAAYADEGVMDEALWHMMRSFEIRPDLREIRQQLRYLYELRDGRAPGRLHLNRAALARVYLRDGWYERAVEEIQAERTTERDRVDLLSALAEAQWRAGRRQDAASTAHQLMMELPYSLKANLILGQLYAADGDSAQAERYLQVAQELDPENEMAQALFGEEAHLPPTRVILEPLSDEEWAATPHAAEEPLPEWLADLSLFAAPALVDDQAVDWAAIVAFESDWRTLLSKRTQALIGEFRPNWRVELRRATVVGLSARGLAPRRAAPRPAPAAPAPAAPAPAAPAPRPWQSPLRHATAVALAAWQPSAPTPWAASLRQATTQQLAAWRPAPTTEVIATLDEVVARTLDAVLPTLPPTPPLWADALRADTLRTLAAWSPAEPLLDRATWAAALRVDTSDALTAEPLERALASDAPWAAALRADTSDALTAEPLERALASDAPWAAALRADTSDALTAEPLERALASDAPWAAALRADTSDALRAPAPPPLVERMREGADSVRQRAQEVTEAAWRKATDTLRRLREEPEEVPPQPWQAALREATESSLAPPSEPGLAERLADVAGEVAQRVQGLTETLRERASERFGGEEEEPPAPPPPPSSAPIEGAELPSFWDVEAIVETVTRLKETPWVGELRAATQAALVAEPVTPLDDLGQAQAAWSQGEDKAALLIFQRLVYEGGAGDDAIGAALEAWIATERAPGLAYQLLGDIYRRSGRMQEAVAQYREAVNRM